MARVVMLLLYDCILASLAIEDFRKRKISNLYSAVILFLAVAAMAAIPEINVTSRIYGMFAVSVPMLFFALLLPGSFGGGDVKLTFACGAFLGWKLLLDGTVIAIFLAGIHCIWLICTKNKRENMQFALGPYLSTGYIISSFSLF